MHETTKKNQDSNNFFIQQKRTTIRYYVFFRKMYICADIWSCEIRFARILIVNVYKIGGFCYLGSVFERCWYFFVTVLNAVVGLAAFMRISSSFFFSFFLQCVNHKRKNLFAMSAAKVKSKYELCNDVTAKSEEKFCKTSWDLRKKHFFWESNGELQMATLQRKFEITLDFCGFGKYKS